MRGASPTLLAGRLRAPTTTAEATLALIQEVDRRMGSGRHKEEVSHLAVACAERV